MMNNYLFFYYYNTDTLTRFFSSFTSFSFVVVLRSFNRTITVFVLGNPVGCVDSELSTGARSVTICSCTATFTALCACHLDLPQERSPRSCPRHHHSMVERNCNPLATLPIFPPPNGRRKLAMKLV